MTILESSSGIEAGEVLDFEGKRITNTSGFDRRVFNSEGSGDLNFNLDIFSIFKVTATGDVTINIQNAKQANKFFIIFEQDSTGGHALNFPSEMLWNGGTVQSPSSNANEVTIYSAISLGDGSKIPITKKASGFTLS